MYVAEVYVVGDDFAFLFVKYCLGFLFVLFVPVVVLLLEADIRVGIRSGQTSTVPYEQKLSFFNLGPCLAAPSCASKTSRVTGRRRARRPQGE